MANLPPNQPLPPPSGSTGPPATSRWARNGEPGAAFNGVSRGGRGRGSGRGRGVRGARGGIAREGKPVGGDDKTDATSKQVSTPASKPIIPNAIPEGEKQLVSPVESSSRAKGSLRKASRTTPPVAPRMNTSTDAPSSPNASSPQYRRRRSQSNKAPAAAPPKIRVPPKDDSLLRPQRNRTGPVPHSAPIKDTPPHLAGSSFGIRNDIDALVERVRAVAMADNRPSTPGSHIDWAGDDDDSLPDLDDWGVTPATGTIKQTGMISPIIIGSLKPLPGVDAKSPLPPPSETTDLSIHETHTSPAPEKTPEVAEMNELKSPTPTSSASSEKDNTAPITASQKAPAKVTLHPSLPAKPIVAADTSTKLPKSRQGPSATPMRNNLQKSRPAAVEKPSAMAALDIKSSKLPGPTSEHVVDKPSCEQGLEQSIHSPFAKEAVKNELLTDTKPRNGLTASIHAPEDLLESVSVSNNIPLNPSSIIEHRTHTRAQTAERPPSFPRPEISTRPSRSGYTTPRGKSSPGGHHARTHSTPPAGFIPPNNRNPHSHRPVITGDAISRLARTIGGATLSPPRPAAIASHD